MSFRSVSIAFFVLLFSHHFLLAQESPVLFSVEGKEVTVEEFNYIYEKTNGDDANYSKASVMEYLDLYKRFKLKVHKAKELKLDENPNLQNELAGYRRQLSNSYLIGQEIEEKLVKEAYNRLKFDVNISHILAKPGNGSAGKKKIDEVYSQLKSGKDFEVLAGKYSDDPNGKTGGNIGFITALQLPEFYALENAAYNTPVGQYSEPVETALGYHIVKVIDKRPARGEMNVAQIMTVIPKGGSDTEAKKKINEVFNKLKAGAAFDELAKTASEDMATARKGGEVGFFKINTYDQEFEDAAFSIKKDGEYTKPFKSSVGWHILKRIEKKELPAYEFAKGVISSKVRKDQRYRLAKKKMTDQIKVDNGFKINNGNLQTFMSTIDDSFLTPRWAPQKAGMMNDLFSIGTKKVTLRDFISYLERNQNTRLRLARGVKPNALAKQLFETFADEEVIKYEETQLEERYPEFKALMREYEEGILLFEVTKQNVWDKASSDTVGLKKYYSQHKDDYQWKERAKVSILTIDSDNPKIVNKIKKLALKKSVSSLLAKFNAGGEVLKVDSKIYERGKDELIDKLTWKPGSVGKMEEKDGKQRMVKIDEILPPAKKTLKEARGYIVADYQDFLEKEWVAELMKSYTVETNQEVLNSIIK